MKFFKLIIILIVFVMLQACASMLGGSTDPDTKARQIANLELGWNQALMSYQDELQNCYPVKTALCIIEPEDTLIVDKAIMVMRQTRSTCLNNMDNCDACQMANAAVQIANVIGGIEGLSVTAACSDSLPIDAVLRELENAPPAIVE